MAEAAEDVVWPLEINETVRRMVEEIAAEANLKAFDIRVLKNEFTGDNFVGDITRIRILPSGSGDGSINLVMKSAPRGAATRDSVPIAEWYRNELFTYTDVLPAIERMQRGLQGGLSFARFCRGTLEEFNEAIIMKDLADEGFVMRDKWSPMDLPHAELVVQYLGRLHASSLRLRDTEPRLFDSLKARIPRKANYGDRMDEFTEQTLKSLIPKLEPELQSKMETFGKVMCAKIDELLDAELSDPHNVICHGDCWNNNILFKYQGKRPVDAVLIDWQITRLAAPATDLAYFLCTSLDGPALERHLQRLLLLYREAGAGVLQGPCPEPLLRAQLRAALPFGLAMAVFVLPNTLLPPCQARTIESTLLELNGSAAGDPPAQEIGEEALRRINTLLDYFIRHQLI